MCQHLVVPKYEMTRRRRRIELIAYLLVISALFAIGIFLEPLAWLAGAVAVAWVAILFSRSMKERRRRSASAGS